MPYSEELEERIEAVVAAWDGIEKKRLFGGLGYLSGGNMCFGIFRDELIVRMAPAEAAARLAGRHVRPFDVNGRPMRGWLMVAKGSWRDQAALADWLALGRVFAASLPPKVRKRKSLEEIYYGDRGWQPAGDGQRRERGRHHDR
jgi:TfoX/Sxy family transcriptional regulator of competence genes